jgi:hypothetical protein
VGAARRFLAPVAALALVLVPSTAVGATSDLNVSVGSLTAPAKITLGNAVGFGVRYTVRGPVGKRARATVVLVLADKRNRYRITSLPADVRPAIWVWRVTDTLPKGLESGPYSVTATVTLRRGKLQIGRAKKTMQVTVVSTRG